MKEDASDRLIDFVMKLALLVIILSVTTVVAAWAVRSVLGS